MGGHFFDPGPLIAGPAAGTETFRIICELGFGVTLVMAVEVVAIGVLDLDRIGSIPTGIGAECGG